MEAGAAICDKVSRVVQSADEAVESCRNAQFLGTDLHGFK